MRDVDSELAGHEMTSFTENKLRMGQGWATSAKPEFQLPCGFNGDTATDC